MNKKISIMRQVKMQFRTNLSTNEIQDLLDRFCMRDLDDLGNDSANWEITN